jgi:hypothetical protein
VQRGEDLILTHGTDGAHSGCTDPHPFGKAIDIRTHNLRDAEATREALKLIAGAPYTIRLEDPGVPNEHIHAQVRKDTTYP